MRNRFADDGQLMKALHADAYRMSVKWNCVEPEDGNWNEAARARYAEWRTSPRAPESWPMMMLPHKTFPLVGGESARSAHFVAEAAPRVGSDVHLWCTPNDPNCEVQHAHNGGQLSFLRRRSAAEAVYRRLPECSVLTPRLRTCSTKTICGQDRCGHQFDTYQRHSRWPVPD
jgi:beta-glucosidase/6-phospho-beta-glucosidase/beta-galactosidase